MFFEAKEVSPYDEKNVLDIIEKVSKSVVTWLGKYIREKLAKWLKFSPCATAKNTSSN